MMQHEDQDAEDTAAETQIQRQEAAPDQAERGVDIEAVARIVYRLMLDDLVLDSERRGWR